MIAAAPVTDTIKQVAGGARSTARSTVSALWAAQTPQVFEAVLREALGSTELWAAQTTQVLSRTAAGLLHEALASTSR